MPTRDAILKTVAAVHAAGLDESLWPEALAATAGLLGGNAAILEVFAPPSQVPREFHAFGLPPTGEIEYFEHYAPLSPRAAYAFRHPGDDLIWDYKFIDEAAMDRDPFYAKLLPQGDFRYYLAGCFSIAEKEFVAVSVQRTRRQGHADKSEIALLGVLMPHFRLAYDAATRLRSARGAHGSFERALDWLIDGAILLRADGGVAYANETIRAFDAADDGIRLATGGIEFRSAEARGRLESALAAVRRLSAGDPEAPPLDFSVQRPSGAPPYLVSVRPAPGNRNGRDARDAVAVIFVRDPLARKAAEAQVLRNVFGLTDAEADLARALQLGVSPVAYARQHWLSPNTVYTHLRRIKEKTGARRMGELIQRLNDLRARVRPG